MKGQVRIIGGTYRGKKIHFPALEGLRPTADRVKETLFNWLMHAIQGARCLDAFAGSGSLGFEALSRGAKEVVMLETSKEAFTSLKKNALSFNASSALELLAIPAETYLQQNNKPFDLVFLDPPFQKNNLKDCLKILGETPSLRPGGLLYVESSEKILLDDKIWALRKSKKAGLVQFALFERLDF